MHVRSKKKLGTNEYYMRLVWICSAWDFHDAVQPALPSLLWTRTFTTVFIWLSLEKLHNKAGNDASDGYELLFIRGRAGQHQLMKIRRLMACQTIMMAAEWAQLTPGHGVTAALQRTGVTFSVLTGNSSPVHCRLKQLQRHQAQSFEINPLPCEWSKIGALRCLGLRPKGRIKYHKCTTDVLCWSLFEYLCCPEASMHGYHHDLAPPSKTKKIVFEISLVN